MGFADYTAASTGLYTWTSTHWCGIGCPTVCNHRHDTGTTFIAPRVTVIRLPATMLSPWNAWPEPETPAKKPKRVPRYFAQRAVRAPGRLQPVLNRPPVAPVLQQPFARVRAGTMAAR